MKDIRAQIISANLTKKPTTAETIASLTERLMKKNNAKIRFNWDFSKQNLRGA